MFNKPVFFERNRVGRVYTGGKLFADLFGDEAVDGYLPEEWIASNVVARNKISQGPKEGVSKIKDSHMYFDQYLTLDPEKVLGPAGKFRILVKGLDSSIRLPAQAHPDKAFSREHFNSEYGKTESWMILGKRPGAKLFFGFKDGVTEKDFLEAIEKSETDADAMENLMISIDPQIGDTYMVPAKTVHAIGAGCLILEVQEPSDFTIQPERWCGEYKLSDDEMYIGLSKEDAVKCFQFTKAPDTLMKPQIVKSGDGFNVETIVTEKDTDCFIINRINLSGGKYTLNVKDSYGLYIVIDGEGKLTGDNYSKDIKKGDYFFMPYCAMEQYEISGNMTVVECY